MTLAEFLDRLEQTPRDWRLRYGCIERPGLICPYLAVFGDADGDLVEADEVFDAADNKPGHNPALRTQLLQRTGLAEPEAQP